MASLTVTPEQPATEAITACIQAWGYGPDIIVGIEKTITNEVIAANDAKYIVALQDTGSRLFVGAVGREWPDSERVEERLSAVARAACAFPNGVAGCGENQTAVVVVAPLRRPNGQFLFIDGLIDGSSDRPPRRYLTPAYTGETLVEKQNFDVPLLSYSLGAYHRMMSAAGQPPAPPASAAGQDLVRNVPAYLNNLASEWEREAGEPKDGFDVSLINEMRNVSKFFAEGNAGKRSERLAALPCTWIHDDFQFKNLMKLDDGRLAVVDMTDGSWAPRIFDLAYILAAGGDDPDVPDTDASVPTCAEQFKARIRAYYDGGGGALTEEEAFLLPNVTQIKFMAAAHFWYKYQPNVAQFTKLARWSSLVSVNRELIRAAAVGCTN